MKYFSKLLSMLLVGAMLYSTGCTDYGEDISNLKQELEDVKQEVQGQINVLDGDLDKVQEALQGAIDDANKAIAENKTAIADLQEVADEHGEAIEAAEEAIANAITEFEAAIVKIETDHDADIEAVNTKIAEEAKKATDAINAAVELIVANQNAITALEEKDEELAEDIAKAVTSIQANATKINENAAAIAENATDIADNAAAIETLQTDLLNLTSQFTTYKAELAATIATLQSRLDTAEEAVETLQGNVEELYTLHDNQATLIDYLQNQLNALDSYVSEQLEILNNDITALENSLMDFQKQMNNQIVRLDAAIKEALAEAKAYAEEKANNAQLAAQAYADVLVAQLEKEIEAALAGLAAQIDQVNAYAVQIEANLEAYKESNDAALAKLRGDMETMIGQIVNRIQSIVYVPEYTDGKITIDYATFGNYIIEGRSKIEYQVYPAEGAYAIEQAFKNAETYPDFNIWFDMQGLKTRANAPELKVVDLKSNANGRLEVTVLARNFSDAFYLGLNAQVEGAVETNDYAVSLAVDMGTNAETGSANLSTCFTQITPGKGDAITMRIMYNEKDVTNVESVYTDELTYTNIENNPDFVALPGYYLVFDFMGKEYLKSELHELGYMVNPVYQGTAVIYPTVTSYTILNETTGYNEAVLDITKVDAGLIGKTYNLVVNWHYGDKDADKVYAGASLLITKEQAYVDFAPAFTATWNYLEDAAIDAAKLNIRESDSFDPMAVAHYSRQFGYALADAVVDNLPADTKLADVLNMEPAKVLVNGEEVENMEVVITADGENATVEFLGFEWDKTYDITVVYSLSNVDVNVKFGFETFDRNRKPILVDLGNYTGVYATNLVFTEKVVDTMEGYIAQTVDAYPTNFAGITAAEYLLDVFVTNDYHVCDTDLFTNTVNGVAAENTKLVINEENGQTIAAIYDYRDEVASKDGVIVDALAYSKKMTLWYDQEVEFIKTVNFTAPEVYFQRVANYVEEAFDGYATYVQPYYFPNSDYATALEKFDVNKVDLNAAFDLQEADATSVITVPVAGEDRGIAVSANGNVYRPEFRLTDVKDIYKGGKGILLYDNYISYYGKDEFVNVDANLYLRNDNGAEMKIATNFDAAVEGYEDYTNYVVWGYNPINMPTGEDMFEEVTDYGEYEVDLTEMFSMKDRRGHTGKITGWEMINKGRVYGDNFLVDGNGENGFAEGYNAGYIYGYYLRDEKGVAYGDIIPVDVKFLLKGNDAEQLKAKGLLEVDTTTGIVKFHYTSQVDLRKPITINVAVQITTAWHVSTHENILVIRKKADTVEETPAE